MRKRENSWIIISLLVFFSILMSVTNVNADNDLFCSSYYWSWQYHLQYYLQYHSQWHLWYPYFYMIPQIRTQPQPPKDPLRELLESNGYKGNDNGVRPTWYSTQIQPNGLIVYYPFLLTVIPHYCIFTFHYYGTYHLRVRTIRGYLKFRNKLVKVYGNMWDRKMKIKHWIHPNEGFPQIIAFPRYFGRICPMVIEFEYDVYNCVPKLEGRLECQKENAITQKFMLYYAEPLGKPLKEISTR